MARKPVPESGTYFRQEAVVYVNQPLSRRRFSRIESIIERNLDPYRRGIEMYVITLDGDDPSLDSLLAYLRSHRLHHTWYIVHEFRPK